MRIMIEVASAPSPAPAYGASPRVAVIVPAYGVAHLLGEALASLQAQTMPDWECLVIDDGAPDDVAGAFAPFRSDPRMRLIETNNHGVSAARNTAIAAATAPLIALLDGDDRLRPAYLATMTALLEADPEIRLASCNALLFGALPRERLCFKTKQGTSDGVHGSLADVLGRSFSVYIGATFRRAEIIRIGGFDPAMTHAEDFDVWVRLLELGGTAWYADQVLGEYRVRAHSASANTLRLLHGNMKVYTKAQARLAADHVVQPVITAQIAETQLSLDFQYALLRIAGGETARGLAELRAARALVDGPVWDFSFALWRVLPWLARPMLGWRQRGMARGAKRSSLAAVLELGKA